MTVAQELFEALKDAKPGSNYEPKPVPPPKPEPLPIVPLYAALPPKHVDLPKLGGCVEILYDWESDR